jgi:hypothetical protein
MKRTISCQRHSGENGMSTRRILSVGTIDAMHSVSPVSPIDAGQEAYRDVLVIAFTKEHA